MAKIPNLRKFLYLDSDTVSDYLAQLKESVLTGHIEETEQQKKDKVAGADVKFVKAEVGSHGSVEIRRTREVSAAAQFQRMHRLLSEMDAIQSLFGFDQDIWDQLERDEILEIEAVIRLPTAYRQSRALSGLSDLIDGFKPFKDVLDGYEQVETQAQAISGFVKAAASGDIPLLFEGIGAQGYTFIARLQPGHLHCDPEQLVGEAFVFGKVQRLILPEQTETVYSLTGFLDRTTALLNRKQRRAMAKKTSNSLEEYTDIVEGPALVLLPVAIYR